MKCSVKQIMVAGEVRYKYKKIIQMLRPQRWRKVKKQNKRMIYLSRRHERLIEKRQLAKDLRNYLSRNERIYLLF